MFLLLWLSHLMGWGEDAIVAEVGLLSATEADPGQLAGSTENNKEKSDNNYAK